MGIDMLGYRGEGVRDDKVTVAEATEILKRWAAQSWQVRLWSQRAALNEVCAVLGVDVPKIPPPQRAAVRRALEVYEQQLRRE